MGQMGQHCWMGQVVLRERDKISPYQLSVLHQWSYTVVYLHSHVIVSDGQITNQITPPNHKSFEYRCLENRMSRTNRMRRCAVVQAGKYYIGKCLMFMSALVYSVVFRV